MSFTHLKTGLQHVLVERKVCATFDAAEVCAAVERIISAEVPAVSGRVRARYVKNGTLYIAVASSAVGSEIRLMTHTILGLLNKRFASIKKIHTTIGRIDRGPEN